MTGSFSSLNTALSALRYQQAALDIASTNIANASTDGYVRRRAVGETVGAAAATAVWSRSNEIGSGVQSAGVQRLVDGLLDTRVRREHGRQAYLDTKADAMARVENGLAEPGDAGVASALTDFRSSLQDLVNSPGSEAARSQVLSAASVVADAFHIQARNVADEAGDQRARLLVDQQEVNDAATQLAAANRTIASAKVNGTDVSTLLDSRDQLALRISELTGATATERSDGGMDVMLGGQPLVSGGSASVLGVAGVASDGSATGTVSFTITQPDGTTGPSFDLAAGEMGGTAELLNDTLPTYLAGLNAIVTTFAADLNAAQVAGFDQAGAPGQPLFAVGDPLDPAGTITVAITSPSGVAASGLPGGVLDGSNADALADAITIDDAYQRLVNSFGSSVASVQRLAGNQRAMSTQVDSAREQLAGVSLDEETVNMVLAQHSYEAAARVMTTVDEMLDTLINRTGMVGR